MPVQKSYSYTEPKAKTNQYVSNTVNTDKITKTYSYNQPKTSTPPKTSIGEYKTLGGYTNNNPYVSKDRVGNGQNSYLAQSKPQVKNNYTEVKGQSAVDELWSKI